MPRRRRTNVTGFDSWATVRAARLNLLIAQNPNYPSSDIHPRSDVMAPPAGFEPAHPAPEAGALIP